MSKVEVEIDWDKLRGYVSRNCVEKYARRLLQDKLKEETLINYGWECWILNPDYLASYYANDKSLNSGGTFNGKVDDPEHYVFDVYNVQIHESTAKLLTRLR